MRTNTKLRLTLAALALSVATLGAEAAQAELVKNIVLVHGAFADGSSWAKVITILQAKGYHVKVTSDQVGPHTDLLTEFPYVGPPHNG